MSEHICNICNQKFDNHSLKANHIRWKHNDQSNYIKKISNDKKRRDVINFGEIKEFVVSCKNCCKEFLVKEREFKFPKKEKYYCTVSCANSNSHNIPHSQETKDKLKIIVKKLWENEKYAKSHLSNHRFSSKGEREVRKILKERYGNKNVSSHRMVKIDKIKKAVDLTIKDKNIIIEYDGIWHFDKKIYEKFGTPEKYFDVIEKDIMVKKYCENNNIRLLRVGDKHYLHNRRRTISEIIDFIETSTLYYKELY
jgi:very-short-patch-repair endonuclease